MDDFDKELKVGFLEEAAQAVTDVEQCFLALEASPNDADNLNKIFRLAHNLKGSSKAVGFDKFGEFTHEFESFILKVKNGEMAASIKVVNLLLRANDHVAKLIQDLKNDLNADCDSSGLINEMHTFEESLPTDDGVSEKASCEDIGAELRECSSESSPSTLYSEKLSSEELSIEEMLVEDSVENELLQKMAVAAPVVAFVNPLENKEEKNVSLPAVPLAHDEKNVKMAPAPSAPSEETLRVALSKVESLINFVGEMTILQSVLREQVMNVESDLLKKTVQQIGKVSKEIQDLSMGLRMVPIKPTFQKMQRIVRDTAQSLNKDVAITLLGEETELDKTVLEKINDPLVHLIRNSVDHGIESSDKRVASGKPARGQVKLGAYHHAGKLVLEVSDDGGGLDSEKLKNKAVEKGIIKSDASLSDKEAMALIFAPGFSTKEKVTDVSGRGVGMDVVKTNIQELGGEVQIESHLGQGTTFKIILPLTLAIIDAMILQYANEKFVIPLNHVHETLKPQAEQVTQGPLGEILLLRDENLPMFRLGDFFGIKSSTKTNDMISIVIKSGRTPFVLVVDDILDQSQVVTKQLGTELQGIKGISASTILGDGKPALILEPQDLLQRKISVRATARGAA